VQAGIKFCLGEPQGKLQSLIIECHGLEKKVTGIKTCDGRSHFGDLVIVACKNSSSFYLGSLLVSDVCRLLAGSWTASIIPEAHRTVEATAGTVMFIDIPKDRQDLWERFHPSNYPVWSYRRGEGDK
jgi:sarcosine oxidase/L-pipecolate oxidase